MALGQALLAALAALVALAIALESSSAAEQTGREIDLKVNGRAWELNVDASDHLWISDYQAGEIWHLNPATDVYTAYRGLRSASDGRLDANGDLWWVNYDDYNFGRLDLSSDVRTIWPLTGTVPGIVTGINFDAQGRVWIPDLTRSDLYRFDPLSSEFCQYRLPNNSASHYIVSHDGYLWLADWKLPYIYRIDPADGTYRQWLYYRASDSQGMTFDDHGNLWWGGFDIRPALFRLDPDSDLMTYYNLPSGVGEPAMVDARHNFIWYSDFQGRFGRLDPRRAEGRVVETQSGVGTLPLVECYQDWQPLSSNNTLKLTGDANWTASIYSTTVYTDGWQLYQLPEDSPTWGPWGIRVRDDGVWVVDQERQQLVNIPWQAPASVVACKLEDADGDLATSGDQTPLENWPIDLRADGLAQGIIQTTGLDGCVSWYDLEPGLAYGVQEAAPDGWLALTATSHDFDLAVTGGVYTYTFVNSQQVSIGACKVEDGDGDPTTTGDQSPLADWPIDLRIDGIAQAITQTTGLDGCVAWNGLAPGPAYGVQEALPDGWLALTATSHDFGPATSGGVYSYTFANSRPVSVTACKIEDEDGDATTTGDQAPLENWAIDLRIDGIAQGITQTTGLDGCTAWEGLDPGPAYGIQEALPAGWLALTGTSHDFGLATSGGVYSHTFVNSQQVSVNACKVEDADGDLATTGDRTPLENWPIDLRVDGIAQGITQTTGIDGCASWLDLPPGPAYGAQEALPAGWLALTGTSHDFGPATSGDVYNHTFVNSQPGSVIACKVEDADGDPATGGDQTPLENWPIDLRIDGVAQGITQTTGIDGCAAWENLDLGLAYGVQEALPDGWLALNGTSQDFGPATSGGVYTHTFANSQQVSVSACKVEDADGDLATTGDRTPLQDWAIDLRIDGVAQGITQTTGLDGCTAWEGLAPGPAYGVQEALPAGWQALTGTSHDFGPATSGGVYSHTFVNTQRVSVRACKVEDADGDESTSGDQTPVQDWPMDLRINGAAQGITQTTGIDGCASWVGLAPGLAYGVQEALPAGWLALTGTSHDFGPATPGGVYTHLFVNSQQISISACKVEDEDGDLATGADRTPLENWPIDLRIEGVAQGITQTTGLDGCVTWDGLTPGLTYGAQEETAAGWLNLTDAIHEFPPAQSGDDLRHTFVNSRYATVSACKVEDADGKLDTVDDQTPVPDWTITLIVDGVGQEPGQPTGADGCYTWDGLAPGKTYGLEETLGEGWRALKLTRIDFEPAVSGGSYQYTFINTQAAIRWFVYLPALAK